MASPASPQEAVAGQEVMAKPPPPAPRQVVKVRPPPKRPEWDDARSMGWPSRGSGSEASRRTATCHFDKFRELHDDPPLQIPVLAPAPSRQPGGPGPLCCG